MTTLIGIGLTTSLSAGTGLDCSKALEMKSDTLEVCFDQTNNWLNDSYQSLLKERKEALEQVKLLKEMQRAWIKMRDAQCELASRNTASGAGLAGVRCEVILTQKRANELERMALDAEFF